MSGINKVTIDIIHNAIQMGRVTKILKSLLDIASALKKFGSMIGPKITPNRKDAREYLYFFRNIDRMENASIINRSAALNLHMYAPTRQNTEMIGASIYVGKDTTFTIVLAPSMPTALAMIPTIITVMNIALASGK